MLRVLHIASHRGNLGDMINHRGFYALLQETIGSCRVDKVELREFYYSAKHRRGFDLSLAAQMNSYDLCVIGGGAYFDVRWPQSRTGTTLDLSAELLDAVHVPVLVNAMGVQCFRETSSEDEAVNSKFKQFLEDILSRPNWMVTVRNDGSLERICQRYGEGLASRIQKVPDNGFFCPFVSDRNEKPDFPPAIGFCLTTDLFSKEYSHVEGDLLCAAIADLIERLIGKGYHIVLIPHIPSDIEAIACVLSNMNDEAKRNHLLVAPYDAGSSSAPDRMVTYYRMCRCVIGMRFHSVVTALNQKIPTAAFAGRQCLEGLLADIGLRDLCIPAKMLVDDPRQLCDLICRLAEEGETAASLQKRSFLILEEERRGYKSSLASFLRACGGNCDVPK